MIFAGSVGMLFLSPAPCHSVASLWRFVTGSGRVLVAVRVAVLGGGLCPPSDRRRAPEGAILRAFPQECAGKAGARTEARHRVASLWRCAWHSIVTATGNEVI